VAPGIHLRRGSQPGAVHGDRPSGGVASEVRLRRGLQLVVELPGGRGAVWRRGFAFGEDRNAYRAAFRAQTAVAPKVGLRRGSQPAVELHQPARPEVVLEVRLRRGSQLRRQGDDRHPVAVAPEVHLRRGSQQLYVVPDDLDLVAAPELCLRRGSQHRDHLGDERVRMVVWEVCFRRGSQPELDRVLGDGVQVTPEVRFLRGLQRRHRQPHRWRYVRWHWRFAFGEDRNTYVNQDDVDQALWRRRFGEVSPCRRWFPPSAAHSSFHL
jgi:hypothetical protein